jgi:FkbM family methyltransferase
LLRALGVDLIVDVGANVGQFGREVREFGYRGRILSVEPMQAAFQELSAATDADPLWEAVRSAAGAEAGELEINVAANSISSSPLRMLERHVDAAPGSGVTHTERVPVDRLDAIASAAADEAKGTLIKIDTQGFEREVLDGAPDLMARSLGLELELSLVPLYEGQPLWLDQIEFLSGQGFRTAALSTGFWDHATGETLQVNALFARSNVGLPA